MSRLAVLIQTAMVGDCVLTLTLAHAAAEATGHPSLVVTRPATAPLFAGEPAVGAVVPFDKRGRDAGPAGLLRAASRLRGALDGRGAAALLAQGSWRSGLLARAAGLSPIVAFDDDPAALLAHRRAPRRRPRPADELDLLGALGLSTSAPTDAGRLTLHPEERRAAASLLGALPRPRVALAPGSARATKAPPAALLAALGGRLVKRGSSLVGVGGPGERERTGALLARCGGPSLNTAGDTLREAAAILATCDVLVGGDSGLAHLAQAVGTPAVVVHGPTPRGPFLLRRTGAGAARIPFVASAALPCRPCSPSGPPACPRGHLGCMRFSRADLDRLEAATVAALAAPGQEVLLT